MLLIYDLGRNILVQKAGSSSLLAREDIVRGDERNIVVRFVRGSLTADPPGTMTEMIFVAKSSRALTAPTILKADSFTYDSETKEWSSVIAQNLAALADLLGAATSIDLFAEITFRTSTLGVSTSQVFTVRATDDLWKGTEGTPLSHPSPEEWLSARAQLLPIVRTSEEGEPIANVIGTKQSITKFVSGTAGTTGNIVITVNTPGGPETVINAAITAGDGAEVIRGKILAALLATEDLDGVLCNITPIDDSPDFGVRYELLEAAENQPTYFSVGYSLTAVTSITSSTEVIDGEEGIVGVLASLGQLCRVGDSSPFDWYRWDGISWSGANGGSGSTLSLTEPPVNGYTAVVVGSPALGSGPITLPDSPENGTSSDRPVYGNGEGLPDIRYESGAWVLSWLVLSGPDSGFYTWTTTPTSALTPFGLTFLPDLGSPSGTFTLAPEVTGPDAALGKIAVVTVTNEGEEFKDAWVCVSEDPPRWNPPGNITRSPNGTLHRTITGNDGVSSTEPAYP